MIDSSLLYLLTFVVGSVWITLLTICSEKLGTKWGGFIGGLPSTALISLFFIALNQSFTAAVDATTVFPLAFGISCLFLLCYAILSRRGFLFGFVGSLLTWMALSFMIGLFKIQNFELSLVVYGVFFFVSIYIFEKKLNIEAMEGKSIKYTPRQIILRALFSGSVMTFAVFASKTCGPICGGIFSAFPATFLSTIVITFFTKGQEFSRSMAKTLFVSGMITIICYVTAVRYMYPIFGIGLGTLTSLLICIPSMGVAYWLIKKKLS